MSLHTVLDNPHYYANVSYGTKYSAAVLNVSKLQNTSSVNTAGGLIGNTVHPSRSTSL